MAPTQAVRLTPGKKSVPVWLITDEQREVMASALADAIAFRQADEPGNAWLARSYTELASEVDIQVYRLTKV
jgi:hypothetical protein